jgi:hypothetical protein
MRRGVLQLVAQRLTVSGDESVLIGGLIAERVSALEVEPSGLLARTADCLRSHFDGLAPAPPTLG